MELYTLDPLLRRTEIVDRFQSMIWTERYSEHGDFELVVRSTPATKKMLQTGTLLVMNESNRIMKSETMIDGVDDEGRETLEISGRSLEAIFWDRVAKESRDNLETSPTWNLEGAPAWIVRKVVTDICIDGILSEQDIIPFLQEGSLFPPSTVDEPPDPIKLQLPPKAVYEIIKEICDVWYLGFRILRNGDLSQLYFDVYSGDDRTTSQTTLSPVVFAPELDNLKNTKELTTIETSKNVAYVFSPAGFLEVYPPTVPPDTDGFDRQVLVVQADDITSENPDPEAAMLQRGLEELAKNRATQAFDGEISQRSSYKYGVDYRLGDLIDKRGKDGITNQMRVTEQIFISDEEGDRSYPTLELNTFVNSGSWLSWEQNQTWFDLDDDPITWAES